MASFTPNSLSYLDHQTDFKWDLLSPFTPINNPMDYQSLMGFSNDNLLTQQTSLVQEKVQEINNNISGSSNNNFVCSGSVGIKRKGEELVESTSLNSSSPISSEGTSKKNNSGRGKRTKTKEKTEEKPNEVVHVRARRGQATDSHSIAERIRRGKINERLKYLQEIVPGCNKQTMGMAVVLDEIINYIQSLQNQVEFLSMKLTAASQFHDFNTNIELHEKTLNTFGSNCNEAQEDITENTIMRGYDQDLTNFFQQTWPF